jgi:hypothetical protein
MKFTCNRDNLVEAINVVQRAISGKTTMPILEGILIEVIEELKMTANDLDLGITYEIPAIIEEVGSVLVSSKTFGDIVRKLPDIYVTIETSEANNLVIITSGKARFEISMMDIDEYPQVNFIDEEESVTFENEILRSLIKQSIFATADDVIKIYNEFALKRNIMFHRYDDKHFFTNPDRFKGSTYIWYDNNRKPASYISLSVENYYHVNHMRSINLNVYEMAFTSKESLLKLFGFMRMFEGENDTVKIHNCAMSPEIDLILRHYIHTTYKRYPDLMARILDVKTILESNTYPQGKGHFRVNITDDLEYTKGVWEVEFENGVGVAKRVDKDKYDVSLSMPAFTQIVYGYDKYNADVLAYMDGVEIFNEKSDFFHVFPKRYNGLFEHF